jgi:hypothetical protein
VKAPCFFWKAEYSVFASCQVAPVIPVNKEKNMLKKQLTLLFVLVLTFQLALVFAQQASGQAADAARVEGRIVRSSKENSSLTIRNPDSNATKTVVYDDSTKWVSQYHADKKVNDIDRTQVKDGDYVICTGTWGKAAELQATMCSKRLSHPN